MTATYVRWYYSVDNSTVAEITDRVELPIDDNGNAIGVGGYAEEGSGWAGQLIVNDPAGDLMMLCHRRIYAVMEAATTRTVVGNWFITDLDVIRMDPFSGAARQWQVSMVDENSLLERRILVGTDAVRPAETDIARIRWLLTTTELNTLDPDETYIDTTGPVDLDANDYTGQKCSDVIADCSQQSKKNYFVMYREDLTPHVYSLAYFDFNTSSLYASTLSLTNVASEVDIAAGVYPISADTKLSRSGARIASGEYLPYSGGYVYGQNSVTGTTYVYRDVAAPAINVKSSVKANARLANHLAQMTEPDDEVTTEIVVEEADLNLAMHGMSIPLHATHLPDYTATAGKPDYANGATMRIKRREVIQVGPTTFRVPLVLTPKATLTVPFGILYRPGTFNLNPGESANIGWVCSGDPQPCSISSGLVAPTTGLLETLPGTAAREIGISRYLGFTILGTGTIDFVSNYTVFTACAGQTVRVRVKKNGVSIATSTYVTTGSTGQDFSVNATGVSVSAGDVITATAYHEGASCGIYWDATSDDADVFQITGGSLT